MATEREDEVEYESDPEETKQSLTMRRRRAASDDEESEKEEALEGGGGKESRMGRIRSEESDSEGGAADYDDEEGELEEEEEELDGEEEEEEGNYEDAEEAIDEEEANERRIGEVERNDGVEVGHEEEKEVVARDGAKGEGQIAVEESLGEWGEDQAEDQVEKKENEPYAVPTAGAFYMHDDRFRDNVGGRNRYCSYIFTLG